MRKSEKWIKLGGIMLCESFAVFTIIHLLVGGETDRLVLAFFTLFLILAPLLLEKIFHSDICLPVYIFALAYAIGPMLGHCWKFYYTVRGWDKLLHTSGGVMFCILGAYFFDFLTKNKKLPGVRAIFALCFSVTVAVLWEFFEFGADTFFGMDMQNDTIIHAVTSHLLEPRVGITGSITDIESVIVNGTPLPMNGYIDIGLIDSMMDLLLETIGAAVTCIILWLDGGRHRLIRNQSVVRCANSRP